MGAHSSTQSQQYYNGLIAQNYQGTCDVECTNMLSDVNITLIDTDVKGGINFDQTCNANSQCLVNSTMDSISDVVFTAANSSTAKKSGILPSINKSNANSLQSIQSSINNQVNEECKTTSANDMSNISIFASDVGISGGINFAQSGLANGSCQLNNAMQASSYATGTSNNCASAGGKKKKKSACAGKNSKGAKGSLSTGVIVIIVLVIILFISRGLGSKPSTPQLSQTPTPLAQPLPQLTQSSTPTTFSQPSFSQPSQTINIV